MCIEFPLIFEFVVLLYIFFTSEVRSAGFIDAKLGIGEHSQGQAAVSARFYLVEKNRMKTLSLAPLKDAFGMRI